MGEIGGMKRAIVLTSCKHGHQVNWGQAFAAGDGFVEMAHAGPLATADRESSDC